MNFELLPVRAVVALLLSTAVGDKVGFEALSLTVAVNEVDLLPIRVEPL